VNLAQAVEATNSLLTYGPLGIVAAIAIYAVAKMYVRETQRADKAEAAVAALQVEIRATNEAVQRTLIGLVTDTTKAINSLQREVQK
jgi:hypothetical protein